MINTMEVAPEELPGLDLFQNCRLCLAKEKVSVDIFSEGHEIRLLYYKIVSCLPVHVTQDDKLPRKICMQCNEKVDNFYQFWTLTAKSQKTLLDWVEKKDLLPPAKIKTENVPPGEVLFKQEVPDYSDEDNDNDNDRYEDDNSEEDLEPSTVVKVCEETEETAGGTTPGPSAGTKIKSSLNSENERIIDDVTYFKCDICERNFRNKKLLDRHELVHKNGPLVCDLCKHTFKEKYMLQRHMLGHLDDKPFSCDTCGKKFRRRKQVVIHNLVVHQGLEHDSKPYKCTLCPKSFNSQTRLGDHQYVHTGCKRYVCHLCADTFASKRGLILHIKVMHEGHKRLRARNICQCEHCGKNFSQRYHYRRHVENIHGDGKPKCNVCGKIVSSKEFLAVHMNMHTGNLPYKCPLCLTSFRQRSSFTGHYKSKHPGVKPPNTNKIRSKLT